MYICYYGWGLPQACPQWFIEGIGDYTSFCLTDCEWIVPGTIKE